MRKQKDKAVEAESLTGETITGPREYTLKKPITYEGKDKVPGDKVKLDDRQAEWLRGSGHI